MNPKVRLAIAYIEHNPDRALQVSEIAHLVRLSRWRFCHLFKNEAGMSVTQYRKKIRMEKARRLLETSFEPVKAIAAQVAYHDPNHFEREFKKFHGLTPSRYRAASLTRISLKGKQMKKTARLSSK